MTDSLEDQIAAFHDANAALQQRRSALSALGDADTGIYTVPGGSYLQFQVLDEASPFLDKMISGLDQAVSDGLADASQDMQVMIKGQVLKRTTALDLQTGNFVTFRETAVIGNPVEMMDDVPTIDPSNIIQISTNNRVMESSIRMEQSPELQRFLDGMADNQLIDDRYQPVRTTFERSAREKWRPLPNRLLRGGHEETLTQWKRQKRYYKPMLDRKKNYGTLGKWVKQQTLLRRSQGLTENPQYLEDWQTMADRTANRYSAKKWNIDYQTEKLSKYWKKQTGLEATAEQKANFRLYAHRQMTINKNQTFFLRDLQNQWTQNDKFIVNAETNPYQYGMAMDAHEFTDYYNLDYLEKLERKEEVDELYDPVMSDMQEKLDRKMTSWEKGQSRRFQARVRAETKKVERKLKVARWYKGIKEKNDSYLSDRAAGNWGDAITNLETQQAVQNQDWNPDHVHTCNHQGCT